MQELILHHYLASPYSEKVRLVLGFKKLRWKSVIIPAIMPKPDVIALTGGYRRTPLLQIGADVYCDTTLICRVLERIAPTPTLFPFGDTLSVEALSRFGDEVLVNIRPPISSMPGEDLASFFPGASPEWLERYRADRAAMRQGAGTGGRPPADHQATSAYFLPRVEAQFADGRAFLLGDAACLADFAVYHTFWVVARVPSLVGQLADFVSTLEWMRRMKAMGHGESVEISSAEALYTARSVGSPSVPTGKVLHGELAAGQMVEVVPTDAGSGQVRGRLLGCSETEISVVRTDVRASTVVVHFPRMGYRLRPS